MGKGFGGFLRVGGAKGSQEDVGTMRGLAGFLLCIL